MIGGSDIRRVSEMERQASPFAEPWPDGVTHRYANHVGATVDITGSGSSTNYRCTACPYGSSGWAEWIAHERAQEHASVCRALPRPEASR